MGESPPSWIVESETKSATIPTIQTDQIKVFVGK